MHEHGGATVVSPGAVVVSPGTVGIVGSVTVGGSSSVDIKMLLKHNSTENHLLLTACHWIWDWNLQIGAVRNPVPWEFTSD